MPEDPERRTTGTGASSTEEEARLERARQSRRRYKERQKNKDQELEQQIKDAGNEIEKLRLEQESLSTESSVLHSLCAYSNSMLEALTEVAAASAAKARSLGEKAVEKVIILRGWAEHHWVMLPTADELINGSFWTPPDDQIRFFVNRTTPDYVWGRHWKFLGRLDQLLEEGKRSPASQKDVEMKISYLLTIWVRLITIATKERPEMMEAFTGMHLKTLRDEAAAGQYVRPLMLRSSPTEVAGFKELSNEQKERLEKHWKQFVKDIRMARLVLGQSTAEAQDRVEEAMATGEYNPASSADAAKCFLLTWDAAAASDDFLAKESRAFIKLWVGAVHVLTPMQTAIVLTSCRPLVPHLPDICNMLLNSNSNSQNNSSEIDGQSYYISSFNEGY